jgi:hypothetical protein
MDIAEIANLTNIQLELRKTELWLLKPACKVLAICLLRSIPHLEDARLVILTSILISKTRTASSAIDRWEKSFSRTELAILAQQ